LEQTKSIINPKQIIQQQNLYGFILSEMVQW